ncbi:hypothetical protein [Aliamphritea ceti]|uniref:hypothetical protein n=1 Tax=Aliamphritea ceti TaxID=1524258 RepID=UPI0021C42CB8|nr:hypothetical protein [Aliamphritea ceti]
MPRKLTLDSLRAELSSVNNLISSSIEAADILGEMQFNFRKEELESKIQELEKQHENNAKLALFFGGKPVLGSLGINSSFAGPALDRFQDIVTKVYANIVNGELGQRGKVAFHGDTNLMVTGLAKGSFGFVLEETDNQLTDTTLKLAVESAADILKKCGSHDEDVFEEVIDDIDKRVLDSLREFFSLLDKNEANVRLVEDLKEFTLDSRSISLAKQRIESTQIDENVDEHFVLLTGFLPEHRRFEANLPSGESIHGTATKEAASKFFELSTNKKMLQTKWKLAIQKRVFKARNTQERVSYKLIDFIE